MAGDGLLPLSAGANSKMAQTLSHLLFTLAVAASLGATVYLCFALVGIHRYRRRRSMDGPAEFTPAVTILKPICGVDFELWKNLRSFCEQDYPVFQIIFVVRSPDDPAVEVIEQVVAEFPDRDITLVVDPRVHGTNLKVSNLINAFPAAKHDILVIADSDMRVRPNYLAHVVQPFREAEVGVVTCLYKGVSAGNFLSDLACLQINEWFLPSVLVAGLLQGHRHCFGSTMAIRREILARAGGLESLVNMLADDHMIGRCALDQGYRVELAPYLVENVVQETTFRDLFAHELRWARTIWILNPAGHCFSFLICTISVALISLTVNDLTLDIDPIEWGVIGVAVLLRMALHRIVSGSLGEDRRAPYWMVPLRDVMSFAVWAASFLSRDVRWRDGQFNARPDGSMIEVEPVETT